MNIQREFEKKIKLKEEEARELEQRLAQTRAQLDAFREALRIVSRSADGTSGDNLRPGSLVDQARKKLLEVGKPLHVDKLLIAIGKENNKNNKTSLAGSLGQYVRQGIIFTKPAPNTFGLKEFEEMNQDDVPENFGREI